MKVVLVVMFALMMLTVLVSAQMNYQTEAEDRGGKGGKKGGHHSGGWGGWGGSMIIPVPVPVMTGGWGGGWGGWGGQQQMGGGGGYGYGR